MTSARRACWLVAAAALAVAGCKNTNNSFLTIDTSVVEVDRDRITITSDKVGGLAGGTEVSYVMVSARHSYPDDLLVTLDGTLLDADGNNLSQLRSQTLRVPSGGERVYALVDAQLELQKKAHRAEISVRMVSPVNYPPPVVIRDGRVDRDSGRAVVAGTITNTKDGPVAVVVIAAFFDAAGAPVAQQTETLRIDANGHTTRQFVGPAGTTAGTMFVGDVAY